MQKELPLSRLKAWGWNRRRFTLAHVYDLCETENILLIERPYEVLGRYDEVAGQARIRLTTRGSELERLHIACHELGHWALHTPGHYGLHSKTETEADIIADCALMPRALLGTLTQADWMTQYGYPHWLVERRLEWWRMFRM